MPKDIFTYYTQVFFILIIQIIAFWCLPSSHYRHQALWNLFVVLSSSHLSPWSENPCHWRSSTWKYIDVMHILWYSTIVFIHYIQHYKAVPIIPYYSPVILSLTVESTLSSTQIDAKTFIFLKQKTVCVHAEKLSMIYI